MITWKIEDTSRNKSLVAYVGSRRIASVNNHGLGWIAIFEWLGREGHDSYMSTTSDKPQTAIERAWDQWLKDTGLKADVPAEPEVDLCYFDKMPFTDAIVHLDGGAHTADGKERHKRVLLLLSLAIDGFQNREDYDKELYDAISGALYKELKTL
jgi:hypothetical protein